MAASPPSVPSAAGPSQYARRIVPGASLCYDWLTADHASASSPSFDLFDWFPSYQSCQAFFINHAQHEYATQALCSLINLRLPFQWSSNPVTAFVPARGMQYDQQQHPPRNPYASRPPPRTPSPASQPTFVSLHQYVRRLVVTGFDSDGIMHGFFGHEWRLGVGPIIECERRNYLFAAKSVGWAAVKEHYDDSPTETVPFLKPLQHVSAAEVDEAERGWSDWLMLQDWMVGPRAPAAEGPT